MVPELPLAPLVLLVVLAVLAHCWHGELTVADARRGELCARNLRYRPQTSLPSLSPPRARGALPRRRYPSQACCGPGPPLGRPASPSPCPAGALGALDSRWPAPKRASAGPLLPFHACANHLLSPSARSADVDTPPGPATPRRLWTSSPRSATPGRSAPGRTPGARTPAAASRQAPSAAAAPTGTSPASTPIGTSPEWQRVHLCPALVSPG
mmetsp:Transcript_97666/g.259457  ORF Transcript_97666/g.259457 Transcript_97666/m.259457 type:complete len:211 (+) Transcript_97666:240-872(+)